VEFKIGNRQSAILISDPEKIGHICKLIYITPMKKEENEKYRVNRAILSISKLGESDEHHL
jgi:hypothetical protein